MLRRRRDVRGLVASLDDDDPQAVAEAINELAGRLGTLLPDQRERLAHAAREGIESLEPRLRGHALRALGELGADADVFEAALEDSDWFVRLVAISSLARATPPIRIGAISRLRDDPEPLVRESVAAILDEHDERGMPTPRHLDPTTWSGWWARERAAFRRDLVRRDRWNFVLWMSILGIAVAGFLAASHPLAEVLGYVATVTLGLGPLVWLRMRGTDRPGPSAFHFEVLALLIALGWSLLVLVLGNALDWV